MSFGGKFAQSCETKLEAELEDQASTEADKVMLVCSA